MFIKLRVAELSWTEMGEKLAERFLEHFQALFASATGLQQVVTHFLEEVFTCKIQMRGLRSLEHSCFAWLDTTG